jgi:hypothetical protein
LLSEHIFIYCLKTQQTVKTQTLSVLHKQDEGHGWLNEHRIRKYRDTQLSDNCH